MAIQLAAAACALLVSLSLGASHGDRVTGIISPLSLLRPRPPRKSWKNISNLSGGEKTLSSLSLVFALHYFRPTPLYFMDEIDAALDFKNVSIVAHYIKVGFPGICRNGELVNFTMSDLPAIFVSGKDQERPVRYHQPSEQHV